MFSCNLLPRMRYNIRNFESPKRIHMKFIKRILSHIIHAFARAHRFALRGLVYLLETGILLAKSFLKGCLLLFSMGGCIIVFLLIGPVGAWLFQNPIVLLILILIVTFPILGAILLNKLRDFQIVSERHLFGLSEYLKDPEHHTRRSYRYHKETYQTQKAEQARREWERREREQRMWEERFRSYGGGFGAGYGQRTGPYGYSSGSPAGNPYVDFKSKYEKSCETLGIPVTTEESRIKLAYRKKAKQYHPDVNQAADATAKFQEISEAYEFLNEDNIRRYKGIATSEK